MKRRIFCLSLLILMMFVLSGCQKAKEKGATPTDGALLSPTGQGDGEGDEEPPLVISKQREATELAELVSIGAMPKLFDRIPGTSSIYVSNLAELGDYSDTAVLAVEDIGKTAGELLMEGMFTLSAGGTVEPNIALTYSVNSSFTEYVITLRQGMRWSDGVPFTADDCIFFYEKFCVPELFTEPLWSCFYVKGTDGSKRKAEFHKLDDYRFQVVFAASKPEFLTELMNEGGMLFAPEHYFVNILPEYVTEKSSMTKLKEMGYESADEFYYAAVRKPCEVYGLPSLYAFVKADKGEKEQSVGSSVLYHRNPYYWKTDANGKQLPYLDTIDFTKISGRSQGLLLATEGYLSVHTLQAGDVAEVEAAREKSGCRIVTWSNFVYYAVKEKLRNFPEESSAETKLRGMGGAHPEGWFFVP